MYKDYSFVMYLYIYVCVCVCVFLSNSTIKPQYKKHINQTYEVVFCSISISITGFNQSLKFLK